MKPKRKKLKPYRVLKQNAWDAHSRYRREKVADFQGYVICFTCGKSIPWKEAHLGHFKHGKLNHDKMNTNIQCSTCNTYKHGKLDVYAVRLIEIYGMEAVKDLESRAAQFVAYTRQELEDFIKSYK